MDWLQTRRHRRHVLTTAAQGAAFGLAAIGTPVLKPVDVHARTLSAPPTQLTTRPNIYSLDPNGPEVASLRRGVARMMQISEDDPSDPRGWTFQANIHGAPVDVPEKPAWRQCQHGSYFFFPWHRMYLYWFERILRWAAKDDSLALPYWDYSVAEHRILPMAFRQPASDANPLYREERDPLINAGTPPWSVLSPLFDHLPAFANPRFCHVDDLDTSFGGKVAAPMHHTEDKQSTGLLEATPHGQVHVMIGGRQQQPDGTYRTAWMGDIDLAARDPIFWLHHANIDRLWDRWLMLGDGRANPVDDSVWMNTEFGFFDENGDPVQMTASEVLSTQVQLGYVYDDILSIPSGGGGGGGQRGGAPEEAEPPTAGAPPTGAEPPNAQRRPRRSLLGASRAGRTIDLGSDPTTVPIRRDGSGADVSADEAGAYDRLVLTVEGLRGLGVPGVSFEVYLHGALSPGALPPGDAFVGLLSLFGLQPEDAMANGQTPTATQSFDVTTMVRAAMADPSRRGRLSATFVPRILTMTPAPSGPWATATRVALSAG